MSNDPAIRTGFGLELLQLGRQWRQAVDAAIRQDIFPDAGWRPLYYLHRATKPLRQKDLAALIGIEGPSLVPLLDALAASGLLERVEDPQDRRARQLRLTASGEAVGARIAGRLAEVERELLHGVSDDELRAAEATLARIGSALALRKAGSP
jgi:MarR family transcriptional regulator for hemolysin